MKTRTVAGISGASLGQPVSAACGSQWEYRVSEVKHLLFFTAALGGGGAEKHLIRVANHLDRDRFRVTVAVGRGGGAYERELADHVRLQVLGSGRVYGSVGALRRLIARERPDLVFSIMDHANCTALVATLGLSGAPPVVVGVQAPPSIALGGRGSRVTARAVLAAIPRLYPRAARVVALSEGVRADLEALAPRLANRISVIYNAGYDDETERLIEEPLPAAALAHSGGPLVVACGRLTPQKGFEHLLRAFARVRRSSPNARLWLVGEGELQMSLQALAHDLGITEAVWFAGFRDNPFAFMRAGDVFALSSVFEGFGNVIVEAMAAGTAVVATDCPYGPSEIIRDGESGLLVPPADEEALAAAILQVLRDPDLRRSLGRGGLSRARDFTASAAADAYGRTFASVLSAHGSGPRFVSAPRER